MMIFIIGVTYPTTNHFKFITLLWLVKCNRYFKEQQKLHSVHIKYCLPYTLQTALVHYRGPLHRLLTFSYTGNQAILHMHKNIIAHEIQLCQKGKAS